MNEVQLFAMMITTLTLGFIVSSFRLNPFITKGFPRERGLIAVGAVPFVVFMLFDAIAAKFIPALPTLLFPDIYN